METARTVLAAIGCLFVGAGVGLIAERLGVPSDIETKLFVSTTLLLMIWVL